MADYRGAAVLPRRVGRGFYRCQCAGVAEWQTRGTQNAVSLGTCGFDSHLRHLLQAKTGWGRGRIQSFEAFARSSAHIPSKSVGRLRVVAAVIAAPVAALILLALIDLISGGNSHLTRSVIDAGGAGDLADVAERRLELSAHDFAQAAGNPLFWVVIVGIGFSMSQRRRIDAWLRPAPIARAGLTGACTAVAVGVLVNDSGASFLVLGSLALGAFLAFAWSQAGGNR